MEPVGLINELLDIHGDPNRFSHAAGLRTSLSGFGNLLRLLQLGMDLRKAGLDGRFDQSCVHEVRLRRDLNRHARSLWRQSPAPSSSNFGARRAVVGS